MRKRKCKFDPRTYAEAAIGQFHCPLCGEMVLAGYPHPDYSILDTPIKEYPILFKDEMVIAILRGKKTQTRRIITPQPPQDADLITGWACGFRTDQKGRQKNAYSAIDNFSRYFVRCRYGEPEGTLWVKEAWRTTGISYAPYSYRAGYTGLAKEGWKSGMFMPRSAARLLLAKTGIEVQKLFDISDEDAIAEGFKNKDQFMKYFAKINGKRKLANPWVWVIHFELLKS